MNCGFKTILLTSLQFYNDLNRLLPVAYNKKLIAGCFRINVHTILCCKAGLDMMRPSCIVWQLRVCILFSVLSVFVCERIPCHLRAHINHVRNVNNSVAVDLSLLVVPVLFFSHHSSPPFLFIALSHTPRVSVILSFPMAKECGRMWLTHIANRGDQMAL